MTISTAAQQLSVLSSNWISTGHAPLAARLVELLKANDLRGCMRLLGEVERRMPQISIRDLMASLRELGPEDVVLEALAQEPSFIEMEARVYQKQRQMRRLTTGQSPSGLVSAYLGLSPSHGPARQVRPHASPAIIPIVRRAESEGTPEQTSQSDPWIVGDAPETSTTSSPILVSDPVVSVNQDTDVLPAPLVVGGILMLQILTVFFCLFR